MEFARPRVEFPHPLPPVQPRSRLQILKDVSKPVEDISLFELCAAVDAGLIDPSLLMSLDYDEIGNYGVRPTPRPLIEVIEAVSEPEVDVMGEGFGVLRNEIAAIDANLVDPSVVMGQGVGELGNSEIAAIDAADLVDPSLVMGEGFGEHGNSEIAAMDVDNADSSHVLGEGVGQLGKSEFPNRSADDFDDLDIN